MKGAEALERIENLVVRLRRTTLGLRDVRSGRRGLPVLRGRLLLRGLPVLRGRLLLRGLPVLRGRLRSLRADDGQALYAERSELAAERQGAAASALLLLDPADAVVQRVVDSDLSVAR